MDYFDIDSQFISREKELARELRKSRWWHTIKANAQCYFCQKKLKPTEVTMDHLLPISKGGRSVKNNVVPACKECNNRKRATALTFGTV